MDETLSPQQARVFQYLKDCYYKGGSMPTYREICRQMGWRAVGTAQSVIQALIDKNVLARDPQRSRGLRFVQADQFRAVPVLVAAPAGRPLEAIEQHLGNVSVPSFVRGPVFAVRVLGESMKDAGILDGDIAIVRQAPQAENKEIVVAVLDGEVTIKRLVKKQKSIWLYPENPKFKPMKIEDSSFKILGKVIGLHRYWDGTIF